MNPSVNDPGQYRPETTSIDPGLIAILFRLRDVIEHGVRDLQAAGFTPVVFALCDVIDEQTAIYHDTTAFETTEALGEKLHSLGLTRGQVKHFAHGVGNGELLLIVAAEGRQQEALNILAPRGGDHGPNTSRNPHDDPESNFDEEAAVSLDGDDSDDVLPRGMRMHGS